MVSPRLTVLVLLLSVTFTSLPAHAQTAILEGQRANPVESDNGMVVTSHPLATREAVKVLQEGGNAIDASVTAAFVLAVVQPRSGNIGGGGFMLLANERGNWVEAIDYRETAPAAATQDMFLNVQGEADNQRSRFSHQAAGVPGTVAGLLLALERHGTMTRERVLAPAIQLAEQGFAVPPRFTQGFEQARDRLTRWPSTLATFYKTNGSTYQPGEIFTQPNLAVVLKRIAAQGRKGFYQGKTADLIVSEMIHNGGLITHQDLAGYQPKIRQPVHGTYRGYDIYSMHSPSSGGIHIVQILNMLEQYPLGEYGHNSAQSIHLMSEVMRRAYADRAAYLGDQDFVDVPVKGLTSKAYAKTLTQEISLDTATNSRTIKEGNPLPYESNETTHFSIADGMGNVVSNTYTINFSFGSGIVVGGAGFFLNNEMDDFSAKPGAINAYGLVGSRANRIEPHKRMLSSMSPTLMQKDGKNFMVTGTPGGSRIITTTLQVILNVIDHDLNIQSAVNAPRIHHQWWPDEIRIEEGISPDTIGLLESMGHSVKQKNAMGAAQSILIKNGKFYGAADPRRSTSAAQGL